MHELTAILSYHDAHKQLFSAKTRCTIYLHDCHCYPFFCARLESYCALIYDFESRDCELARSTVSKTRAVCFICRNLLCILVLCASMLTVRKSLCGKEQVPHPPSALQEAQDICVHRSHLQCMCIYPHTYTHARTQRMIAHLFLFLYRLKMGRIWR